jgi:hypothetical protein
VLWWRDDLGPGEIEHHRRLPQRAADLPHKGRAGDPVVAVGIVNTDATELVAGELGTPLVVTSGLVGARVACERGELEQLTWSGRAVQSGARFLRVHLRLERVE